MTQKRPSKRESSISRDAQSINLPKPALKSSRSLARVLQLRKTIREISDKKLLRRHGHDRGQRVSVRRLRRPGGMVPQLRQVGTFCEVELA
jgi:hypothetical protein